MDSGRALGRLWKALGALAALEAPGRRHLGGGIWEKASGRRHLGEWEEASWDGIWEDFGKDFGKALGWLWEGSGKVFGGSGGSGGSRNAWDGLFT